MRVVNNVISLVNISSLVNKISLVNISSFVVLWLVSKYITLIYNKLLVLLLRLFVLVGNLFATVKGNT